jgi:hypothetical protein
MASCILVERCQRSVFRTELPPLRYTLSEYRSWLLQSENGVCHPKYSALHSPTKIFTFTAVRTSCLRAFLFKQSSSKVMERCWCVIILSLSPVLGCFRNLRYRVFLHPWLRNTEYNGLQFFTRCRLEGIYIYTKAFCYSLVVFPEERAKYQNRRKWTIIFS